MLTVASWIGPDPKDIKLVVSSKVALSVLFVGTKIKLEG